jgi:flagellar basal body-associated protein FliL
MANENKENKTLNIVIIIAILLIVAIGGTLLGIYVATQQDLGDTTANNTRMYHIPTVHNTFVSTDGSTVNMSADFTLEIDSESRVRSIDELRNTIMDEIAKLDIEQIRGRNGIEYIKSELYSVLGDSMPNIRIEGIFVQDLRTGSIAERATSAPSVSRDSLQFDNLMRSLFPNIR